MTDVEKFKEFINHFNVSRPGQYDVPNFVTVKAFETFMQDGSLAPLYEYEKIKHLIIDMRVFKNIMYELNDLYDAEYLLKGNGIWSCEEVFDYDDIERLWDYIELKKNETINYHDYPARRARANSAISNRKLRERIFKRDGYRCQSCNADERLSIDHITPVLEGGTDEDDNLQTLCTKCNSSKGAK